MKKIVIIFLLFVGLFVMVKIEPVYAADGPSNEHGYIEFYIDGDNLGTVYNKGEIDNEVISGATYDETTNTLTLNNLKSYYNLDIYCMGEDFKLNLVGDNELSELYIDGEYWTTNLNIIGNGSLSINENKESNVAIAMIQGKIIVDDTVSLKLYAPDKIDDCEDCVPYVIAIGYTDTENGKELIKFKNGQNVAISSEQDWANEGAELIKGFGLTESVNPRSYTIVKKNNKKYGMYISGNDYIVTGSEIKYDEVNKECFIDNSDEATDITYSSLEELSQDYTVTSEIVNITKEIRISNYLIQLDEDENEYALYMSYSLEIEDIVYGLYDITDSTITLANGETYTVLKENNYTNMDELTPKYRKKYFDTYSHYVYLKSLEILPNIYEFIEGANQTYIIGQKGLTFKIQALYSLFKNGGKVYVDGTEINDYTSEEGSTVISLSDKYLSSLEEGEHTLKVVFNNGESATTKFTVSKINNPNTLDNIMYWICTSIVSMIFLTGVGLILRKKLITNKK